MEALQQRLEALQAQNEDPQQRLTPQPEATPPVSRISVKLPPFWKDRPNLWFAQVEAQFNLAGITQEATKFAYVVSHLEEKYANDVEDLIISPPAGTSCTTLKKKLIERVSVSETQRVRQLLTEEELGDRKPSQFLRHLRSLAGPELAQVSPHPVAAAPPAARGHSFTQFTQTLSGRSTGAAESDVSL